MSITETGCPRMMPLGYWTLISRERFRLTDDGEYAWAGKSNGGKNK